MRNIALMFPGVGSQYAGMGKTFYDNYKTAKDTFEEASSLFNIDLAKLCFSKEDGELVKLENSQIALLTLSVATFRVYMQEIGIAPKYCVGHSLGEISALCCAGFIRFPDALKIVQERSAIINKVASSIDGTMAWVINLSTDIVESVCKDISVKGSELFVSAYDTTDQSSISGHTDTIYKAAKLLEKEGAIVYPLKMSGPFHSPLMMEAARQMKHLLGQFNFQAGNYPVIANCDAHPYTDSESVIEKLSAQLAKPVQWNQSIRFLQQKGINTAIEIGPKNVLKFLVERNTQYIKTYSLDNDSDLKSTEDNLVIKEDKHLAVLANCLRVAVSTKNLNDNSEEYKRGVILPYKNLENLYQELEQKGNQPTQGQVNKFIETLESILITKKIPLPECQERIYQLLEGKTLKFGSITYNPLSKHESVNI